MRGIGLRSRRLAPVILALMAMVASATVDVWSPRPAPTSPVSFRIKAIITEGLVQPVYLTQAGNGTGRPFVAEQAVRLRTS